MILKISDAGWQEPGMLVFGERVTSGGMARTLMRSSSNWDNLLTRTGTLLFPAEHAASHAFDPEPPLRVGQSTAIARSMPSRQ